jgi:sec-independent protein translocase protein TatA
MFGKLGWPELIIVLVIVLIVFGASRLRGIGSGLGGMITAFRSEVKQGREEDEKKPSASQETRSPPQVNQDEDEAEEDA